MIKNTYKSLQNNECLSFVSVGLPSTLDFWCCQDQQDSFNCWQRERIKSMECQAWHHWDQLWLPVSQVSREWQSALLILQSPSLCFLTPSTNGGSDQPQMLNWQSVSQSLHCINFIYFHMSNLHSTFTLFISNTIKTHNMFLSLHKDLIFHP